MSMGEGKRVFATEKEDTGLDMHIDKHDIPSLVSYAWKRSLFALVERNKHDCRQGMESP